VHRPPQDRFPPNQVAFAVRHWLGGLRLLYQDLVLLSQGSMQERHIKFMYILQLNGRQLIRYLTYNQLRNALLRNH
jgi:hypothetical protein